MKDLMIKPVFDYKIATCLRNTINDEPHFSIDLIKPAGKNKVPAQAWSRICAIMDRIQYTAMHLDGFTFYHDCSSNYAFSFMDFLFHGCVLVDCIVTIAKLYDLEFVEDGAPFYHKVNGKRDIDGIPTRRYIEYLRSICVAHPIVTEQHQNFQDGVFECCPSVVWSRYDSNEVIAQIYPEKSKEAYAYKEETISIPGIVKYFEDAYTCIQTSIIPGIIANNERKKDNLRKIPILDANSFKSYVDYVDNLIHEWKTRFADDNEYYLDEAKLFLDAEFTHDQNRKLLVAYQDALRLAVQYVHRSLQNVNYTGMQNSGIIPELNSEESVLLFFLLDADSESKERRFYGYEISKLHELIEDPLHDTHATHCLEKCLPFLGRYVDFTEAEDNNDKYILAKLALFADCLENNRTFADIVTKAKEYAKQN